MPTATEYLAQVKKNNAQFADVLLANAGKAMEVLADYFGTMVREFGSKPLGPVIAFSVPLMEGMQRPQGTGEDVRLRALISLRDILTRAIDYHVAANFRTLDRGTYSPSDYPLIPSDWMASLHPSLAGAMPSINPPPAGAVCPHCGRTGIQGYDDPNCTCPCCGRSIDVRTAAPGPLNNDAHNESRALHRIVRAMHDGECPKCHTLSPSESMTNHGSETFSHICQSCGFSIKREERDAVIREFGGQYMEKNLEVFLKWREARKAPTA